MNIKQGIRQSCVASPHLFALYTEIIMRNIEGKGGLRVGGTMSNSNDITTVSNTLYNRTSWTTQHAISSDHMPIITTINIQHDFRLQENRRTFTNHKKADWTQFTEDTESAFAQTTIPTNIHTANIIYTNVIVMADKHNIPKGRMHSNCRLLTEDIVCKITQRNNTR